MQQKIREILIETCSDKVSKICGCDKKVAHCSRLHFETRNNKGNMPMNKKSPRRNA